MTVRPFSETPTANQRRTRVTGCGAAPPGASRPRRGLTLLGDVHGLVAEDGLHPAGDNGRGCRLPRPCARGDPARSSPARTAGLRSPPGPGARRGAAASAGPGREGAVPGRPRTGCGTGGTGGARHRPGGCPRTGGALGGRAAPMIPDCPGDPGRARSRRPASPRSAQSQKRQRMTSSRTCSRSRRVTSWRRGTRPTGRSSRGERVDRAGRRHVAAAAAGPLRGRRRSGAAAAGAVPGPGEWRRVPRGPPAAGRTGRAGGAVRRGTAGAEPAGAAVPSGGAGRAREGPSQPRTGTRTPGTPGTAPAAPGNHGNAASCGPKPQSDPHGASARNPLGWKDLRGHRVQPVTQHRLLGCTVALSATSVFS